MLRIIDCEAKGLLQV